MLALNLPAGAAPKSPMLMLARRSNPHDCNEAVGLDACSDAGGTLPVNAPDEGPKNFGVAFALFAKGMTKFFGRSRSACMVEFPFW
jgi:hypothetical protein